MTKEKSSSGSVDCAITKLTPQMDKLAHETCNAIISTRKCCPRKDWGNMRFIFEIRRYECYKIAHFNVSNMGF